jgi:serine beta-lactamase-like protein LACTB, mitochondrial
MTIMTPRRWISLALSALVLLSAQPAQAQFGAPYAVAEPTSPYHDAIERARAFLVDSMRKIGAPGVQVTVMRDGKVIWSEGIGFADVEQRVPMTTLTRLRIGSVSKPLTAAAVGLLVEQGKLDLDAPVQKYVPGFPRKPWPVTTRLAAGHLAGIRHYHGDEFLSRTHYDDVTAGLSIFQGDSLLSRPGTRFAYSTYAWNLVSAVVESAAGEPFLAFMSQRVFAPIGMQHTVAEHPDSLIEFRAHFYTRGREGRLVNAAWVDNSYKWAGGGFLSTTEDLARFADAHLRGGFLKPATLQTLWTSQKTSAGAATGNGIGWFIGTDARGRRTISHSGGSVGGTANLVIFPDDRLIIAALTNTDAPFIGSSIRLADFFLSPSAAEGR